MSRLQRWTCHCLEFLIKHTSALALADHLSRPREAQTFQHGSGSLWGCLFVGIVSHLAGRDVASSNQVQDIDIDKDRDEDKQHEKDKDKSKTRY